MPALQNLTVVPAAEAPEPLCRAGGKTCAGCCWGQDVRYESLRRRIRRQTRLFREIVAGKPSPWRLFLFEQVVRRGSDVFWAVLVRILGLGDWLRTRLQRRMSCAFLGFEDSAETRVGCLLHPTRWGGVDRRRAAFVLLYPLGCGRPDFFCFAAWRFLRAPGGAKERFLRETASLDWFTYSRRVSRFAAF